MQKGDKSEVTTVGRLAKPITARSSGAGAVHGGPAVSQPPVEKPQGARTGDVIYELRPWDQSCCPSEVAGERPSEPPTGSSSHPDYLNLTLKLALKRTSMFPGFP